MGLPGGGILAVQVKEPGYLTAKPLEPKTAGNVLHAADFQYYMYPYHALIPIDVKAGKAVTIPDIAVAPGRRQHIQIVEPGGKPVTGARILCLQVGLENKSLTGDIIAASDWHFAHAHPGQAETIIVSHAGRSLGGMVVLNGDEPDPVRVVLQPTATLTGRLLDEDGKPRPGMRLAHSPAVPVVGPLDGHRAERRTHDRPRWPVPHHDPRPRPDLPH